MKSILRTVQLLIVPVAFVLLLWCYREAKGVYWQEPDPDYAYFVSAVALADFHPPGYSDHPGVSVKIIAATVMRLAHLVVGQQAFARDALQDPEFYLRTVNAVMLLIMAALLYGMGRIVLAQTASGFLATLAQLSPLYFLYDVVYAGTKLNAETTLMTGAFLVGCAALLTLNKTTNASFWTPTILAALGCALGVSAKLNFVPVLVVPLLMLPRMKWRLLWGVLFLVLLALVLAPVLGEYRSLAERFTAYFLKTGVHASGQHGLIPDKAWSLVRSLIRLNVPAYSIFGVGVFVWMVTAVWSLWRPDLRGGMPWRVLTGLLAAFVVQTFAVARSPLSYYLVPVLALAGVLLVTSLWQMIAWDPRRRWFAYLGAGLVGIVCVALSIRVFNTTMQLVYTNFEQLRRAAIARTSLTEKMTPNDVVVFCKSIATPETALHFGNSSSGCRYTKALQRLYPNTYFFHPWSGTFMDWGAIVAIEDIFYQHSNVFFVGWAPAAHTALAQPALPMTDILQRTPVTLFQIRTSMVVSAETIMKQAFATTQGVANDPLMQWLREWNKTKQVDRTDTLPTVITALVRNAQILQQVMDNARMNSAALPSLLPFCQWLAGQATQALLAAAAGPPGDAATQQAALDKLCAGVTLETWPLYVYALERTPKDVARAQVVLPSDLARRGVKCIGLYDGALLWFERYYLNYADGDTAVAFWEWVRRARPELAGGAVIHQAKIEYATGKPDAAMTRLAANIAALRQQAWVKEQARELLKTMPAPAAVATLQKLAE